MEIQTTTTKVWRNRGRGYYEDKITCTVAEAKKFMSSPEVVKQICDKPAKINPGLTKRQAYEILNKFGDDSDESLISHMAYKNMIREFGSKS